MKILITGAKGFIGKNLISELKNRNKYEIYEFDKDTDISLLEEYCKKCDFVFHLAGVNRPQVEKEFLEGNFSFTATLLEVLQKYNNKCPIMLSSSIQASLNNPYGLSKLAGENLLFEYGKKNCVDVFVYRFPNVYGKWCKPNYNSAIATFCYNISRNLEITVNDRSAIMKLVYIDDVVEELINCLENKPYKVNQFCEVKTITNTTLGEIVDLIYSFKESRNNLLIPNMKDYFTKRLYATYISYLPENDFSYPLNCHIDNRGSFTEILRSSSAGQVSVNVFKPGITKGNHWHHTKIEKFIVVAGEGIVRFRKIDSEEIIEYTVSSKKMEVVDVPAGYTHSFINNTNEDMVCIIWANELFCADAPDTHFLEV